MAPHLVSYENQPLLPLDVCDVCYSIRFLPASRLPRAEAQELRSYFAQDEEWVFHRRLLYKHHRTLYALHDSGENGCHCCLLIWNHVFAQHGLTDEDLNALGPVILHQSLAINESEWYENWYPDPGSYLDIRVGNGTEQWGFGVLRFVQVTNLTTVALQMNGLVPSAIGNVRLAKLWLASCWINHPECFQAAIPPMPTRLIDVGPPDGSCEPRLCIPIERARYLTLSHCWGCIDIAKTKKANFNERCRAIPMSILSKTFQQAIQITRFFGMRYLWIDSLCIIQDSAEDWGKEALNMCSVYQNALFNIAASSSKNGNEGLFPSTDSLLYTPCIIPQYRLLRQTGQEICTFITADRSWQAIFETEKQELEGPLYERAWVLQEELLAHATLAFTDKGMVWKCFRACYSSQDPEEARPPEMDDYLIRPFKLGLTFSRNPKVLQEELADYEKHNSAHTFQSKRHQVYQAWVQNTELYLLRKITYPSDRLPALHGLASAMKQVLSDAYSQEVYIAGMWLYDIEKQLLWSTTMRYFHSAKHLTQYRKYGQEDAQKCKIQPPRLYTAPSWSWASMYETPVSWGNYHQWGCSGGWINVLGAESEPGSIHSLTLEGMLLPVLVRSTRVYGVGNNDSTNNYGEVLSDGDGDIPDDGSDQFITLLPVVTQSARQSSNRLETIVCLALKKVTFTPTQYRRIGMCYITEMDAFKHCSRENMVLV